MYVYSAWVNLWGHFSGIIEKRNSEQFLNTVLFTVWIRMLLCITKNETSFILVFSASIKASVTSVHKRKYTKLTIWRNLEYNIILRRRCLKKGIKVLKTFFLLKRMYTDILMMVLGMYFAIEYFQLTSHEVVIK